MTAVDDLLHELGAALKRWRLSRRDDDRAHVARLISTYADHPTRPRPGDPMTTSEAQRDEMRAALALTRAAITRDAAATQALVRSITSEGQLLTVAAALVSLAGAEVLARHDDDRDQAVEHLDDQLRDLQTDDPGETP